MGSLVKENSDAREFVTEILDEPLRRKGVKAIVQFLHSRGVENVKIEFGFVLDRDLEGKPQGQDGVIPVVDLESVIETSIEEGTIKWKNSDFIFRPQGIELTFLLCNDADLHFASIKKSLLTEVADLLRGCGIKVYSSGREV